MFAGNSNSKEVFIIVVWSSATFCSNELIWTWWRHQMETFSALLAICAGNSEFTGEFPTQRPVTRALMFSLICAWINGWVNNREAVDLRRHPAHYDFTVMKKSQMKQLNLNCNEKYGYEMGSGQGLYIIPRRVCDRLSLQRMWQVPSNL